MNQISEFNQRAYELFGRPVTKGIANEYAAKLTRLLHPLRLQRWLFSDLNPALWWLGPTAEAVKANRHALPLDDPARKAESTVSELLSASLDCQRGLRDAAAEATFFGLYGNLSALYFDGEREAGKDVRPVPARELSVVKKALASIDKGGYPEALARVGFLMAHEDAPFPLSRLELAHELLDDYHDLLPDLPLDQVRRIAGEQEIIARYEPERAVETLPLLLSERTDRNRLLTLLDRVLADPRVLRIEPTAQQQAMLVSIRRVLGPVRLVTGGARAAQATRKRRNHQEGDRAQASD
jgi:hypothetical protein